MVKPAAVALLTAAALVQAAPAAARTHRAAHHLVAHKVRGHAHIPAARLLSNRLPAAPASAPRPSATATTTAPVLPLDDPAPTGGAATVVTPPASGTGAPATPAPTTSAIGVSEYEFATKLSRTTITSGSVVVQFRNTGEDPHTLRIERTDGSGDPIDFDQLGPGASTTKTIQLPAGSYTLLCTLADHAALGMEAQLTVTG